MIEQTMENLHEKPSENIWYLLPLTSLRTSMYLEDILDNPDLPGGHHDVWHHYHSITFHLRIPKKYYTWVFVVIKAIKKIPIFGGHS